MSHDVQSPTHRAGEPVRGGIPEHGRVPRYYEVKAKLSALVHELGEGALLPPERELAEGYGVSRVTLRQAVGELRTGAPPRSRHRVALR